MSVCLYRLTYVTSHAIELHSQIELTDFWVAIDSFQIPSWSLDRHINLSLTFCYRITVKIHSSLALELI